MFFGLFSPSPYEERGNSKFMVRWSGIFYLSAALATAAAAIITTTTFSAAAVISITIAV